MPPPNQTPAESYTEEKGSSIFSDLLNTAERGAGIYANIRGARNAGKPTPVQTGGGTSVADEIAAQLSKLVPDSVIDSAGAASETRYIESVNRRYNPNNVVGKSAIAIGLSLVALIVAKKLRLF